MAAAAAQKVGGSQDLLERADGRSSSKPQRNRIDPFNRGAKRRRSGRDATACYLLLLLFLFLLLYWLVFPGDLIGWLPLANQKRTTL